MKIQERIYNFVNFANWILLAIISVIGFIVKPPEFALGIFCGGLIVSINFRLLSRTLEKTFARAEKASFPKVLAKYYLRFSISAIVIFILIVKGFVNPIGLTIGLSIVVMSITLAGVLEAKKLICEETV